ncbi:MAG: TatD family hydrolase [bacterium]
MTILADSHAHIQMSDYDTDRKDVIKRARENNLALIIDVGFNIEESRKAVQVANEYDLVYAAVGIHPHDAREVTDIEYNELWMIVKENKKVVAFGEIGLDYYHNYSPIEDQKRVFKAQIALARELKKPIIFHSRDAQVDTMEIVKSEQAYENGGIMHCFAGNYEEAMAYIDMGFYLSFAGQATFPKAANLHELIKKLPLDKMLLETDCPYLTPVPFRGKRNEPAYIIYVAKKMAELKEIALDEVGAVTFANTKKVLKIPNNC